MECLGRERGWSALVEGRENGALSTLAGGRGASWRGAHGNGSEWQDEFNREGEGENRRDVVGWRGKREEHQADQAFQ